MSHKYPTFSSLLKNASSAFVTTFLMAVIGFALTPWLIHHLGSIQFGLWTLMFSAVSFTELADFGISMSVQRHVAQYVAQNQLESVHKMACQAFTLVLGVMLCLCVLLLGLNVFLPMVFKIPTHLVSQSQWCFGVLSVSTVLLVPLAILNGVVNGFQKYTWSNANFLVFSLLRALLLAVSVTLPSPLIVMSVVLLLLAISRFSSLLFMLRRLCPGFTLVFIKPDRSFLSEVAVYGGNLFLISMLGRVIYTSDTILIGALLNVTFVTYYTIGARWSDMLRTMIASAVQVSFPAFSYLSIKNDKEAIRKILLHGSRMAVGIGLLGASLLILLAYPIIHLWVGPTYKASVPIMRWLGMVGVFNSLVAPFEYYLRAVGQTRALFKISVFNCVGNLFVSITLIHAIGLIGVVWGTLLPLAFSTLFLTLPIACRHAEITWRQFVTQILVPLVLPTGFLAITGVLFHFYPPHIITLQATLLWTGVISVLYVMLWLISDTIPRQMLAAVFLKRRFQRSDES